MDQGCIYFTRLYTRAVGLSCSKSMASLILYSRLPLHDGFSIPMVGLGVYQAQSQGETEQACLWALKQGYRHIDTAEIYK